MGWTSPSHVMLTLATLTSNLAKVGNTSFAW